MKTNEALRKFIAQYGEGVHTSKAIFLFGAAEGATGLYATVAKHATKEERGKFTVDAALVAKIEAIVASKPAKEPKAKMTDEEKAAVKEAKALARSAEKVAKIAAKEAARTEKAEARKAKLIELGHAREAKAAERANTKAAKIAEAIDRWHQRRHHSASDSNRKPAQRKDKKLADINDVGAAALKEEQLIELGYVMIDQEQARQLHDAGQNVLVVDASFKTAIATPVLASDLVLKAASNRFYAKG